MKKSIYTANWDQYYIDNEKKAKQQYLDNLFPIIKKYVSNDSVIADFACGWGRIIKVLSDDFPNNKIIGIDINGSAITHCKKKFSSNSNLQFIKNSENSISEVAANSIDFLYSWDAMVHFSKNDIQKYAPEFHRIVKPGAVGIIHHSNYKKVNPSASEQWSDNVHCRAKVSLTEVSEILKKVGFTILESKSLNWGGQANIDGITIFKKNVK